jgi:DMSO reductase anchor subunit
LRALDYGEVKDASDDMALWETNSEEHPYPLPAFSHTQPRLVIKPHPAMSTAETKTVANLEEIQPRQPSKYEELPLMIFTLLTQLAVGSFWAMNWVFPTLWTLIQSDARWLRLIPTMIIGACLGIGMMASFAHLGRKIRAWRALTNIRRSSISKEILFLSLFGVSWLLATIDRAFWNVAVFELHLITAIFGIGLIYNMSQVYRFPAAPGWNTWKTNLGFLVSAGLLGTSAMLTVLAHGADVTGIHIPAMPWGTFGGSILVLLLIQFFLIRPRSIPLESVRMGLILAAVLIITIGLVQANLHLILANVAVFFCVISEEVIGRWVFYQFRM